MTGRPDRLRVCVVSHSCVVKTNQVPWAALAEHHPVDLTILAPKRWRTPEGWVHHLESLDCLPGKLVGLPVLSRGHPNLHLWLGLSPALRRASPHVLVLDEEPYSLAAWQTLLARRSLDAALVVYAKQNIVKRYPPPICWVERRVLQTAEWLMAVSAAARRVLQAKGCLAPITIVPHGLDASVYCPGPAGQLRRRLGLRGPVVGYVGRLVPEKGVMDLLLAVDHLQRYAGVPCELLIVGDGPERRRLEAFARQRLGGRVHFVGQVNHHDVPDYYRCMDVLVLPSRDAPHWQEQFGRTLVEALACGVAVVGSDCGGIPATVSMTAGLIFPQGDVKRLAEILAELLRNPQLRSDLAHEGRQRVLEMFTPQAIARTIYDVVSGAYDRYWAARA